MRLTIKHLSIFCLVLACGVPKTSINYLTLKTTEYEDERVRQNKLIQLQLPIP